MAYIRTQSTTQKRKGRVQKHYEVVWREPVRDCYGLSVPLEPAKPEGKKKTQARQESFATREDAEARRDELNAARHPDRRPPWPSSARPVICRLATTDGPGWTANE